MLAPGCGTKSVPRQGHNTPLPLRRSPPASFKRLLGGGTTVSSSLIKGTPDQVHKHSVENCPCYDDRPTEGRRRRAVTEGTPRERDAIERESYGIVAAQREGECQHA